MPTDVLTCDRCGHQQKVNGPLIASDGTAMTVEEYLALLRLTGSVLVCEACQRGEDDIVGRLNE